MKKILFLALVASFTLFSSCSVDDNTADFQFEFLPIENVDIPSEFNLGETYTITVTYKRPTTCHSFSNFQYITESNNIRTVAVVSFISPGNCTELEDDFQTETFNFNALDPEPFTFKFWQGKDDAGEDIYLIFEIPVNN
jgi:hypothetical protein